MGRLPPEIWNEITKYNTINIPPPREFLSSTEPPVALHEYPSAYESVSAQDVMWLSLVSTLSRVDQQLRHMYKGLCPRDCLVVTERNISDIRARLTSLPPSSICVRHLMVVLASPPCGHGGADTYMGNAKELYSDLEAIVRCLSQLVIVTLSVLDGQCMHSACSPGPPLYFVDAFLERSSLRLALEDANLQRLTFLEGARALFPFQELSQLMIGSKHLRVASFSTEYQHIEWKLSKAYTQLNRHTRVNPSPSTDRHLYLALPPRRCHESAGEALQVAERLVVDTTSDAPLPTNSRSNHRLRWITLHNPSYTTGFLRPTLYQLRPIPLVEVCIICPLPTLMSVVDLLPFLHAHTLSISIPSRVAGIVTPPVENLPWVRLEKLVNAMLAFQNQPERRLEAVQFLQDGLATRLRHEISTHTSLLLAVRESSVGLLDDRGRSLAMPPT